MKQKIQAYEPVSFWAQKGAEPALRDLQEDNFIYNNIKNIRFNSVLDVGCGDGRMFELLSKHFEIKSYHGIDLSKDRLVKLKELSKDSNIEVKLEYGDFIKHEFKQKYDLVIASHVLLHIHPFDIQQTIDKMISLSNKYVINIDYYPEKGKEYQKLEYYNFLHDYPKLYPGVDVFRYDWRVAMFIFTV